MEVHKETQTAIGKIYNILTKIIKKRKLVKITISFNNKHVEPDKYQIAKNSSSSDDFNDTEFLQEKIFTGYVVNFSYTIFMMAVINKDNCFSFVTIDIYKIKEIASVGKKNPIYKIALISTIDKFIYKNNLINTINLNDRYNIFNSLGRKTIKLHTCDNECLTGTCISIDDDYIIFKKNNNNTENVIFSFINYIEFNP